MLHDYREEISILKQENAHFAKLFEKHSELDHKAEAVDAGREHMDPFELDAIKKEKLRLKDQIYAMCVEYRKSQSK